MSLNHGGVRLRCDGCEALFPERPVRGRGWPILEEAAEAGWSVGGRESAIQRGQDLCPRCIPRLVALTEGMTQDHVMSFPIGAADRLLNTNVPGWRDNPGFDEVRRLVADHPEFAGVLLLWRVVRMFQPESAWWFVTR